MAHITQFWEISGLHPCAISGDGRRARHVWSQDLPGWWWVGWWVLGPFEDSPYRVRELLIWGKGKKDVWRATRGIRVIIYTRYTRCIGYTIHAIYAIHTIHTSHTIEKGSLEDTLSCFTPHKKGSPEDTLSRFTPHRKRVPGRHFDVVYRHTVKMEKRVDTMRQKEQFYCVS